MEIRKLCNQIEKLEVESAKFNASKEAEISKLKAEVKDKVWRDVCIFLLAAPSWGFQPKPQLQTQEPQTTALSHP